jgi:ABC-type glycerol-3-phosphate transport system substrate-binding protein
MLTAGVTTVAAASGVIAAACAPGSGPGAGSPATGAQRGPVTIEVLTRPGVTNPTGHSQFYDNTAKTQFTPQTSITVTFVDAQPSVGEKLTVMGAAGTLPDASWFGVVADGSAGREQAGKGIFKPLDDLAKKDSKFDRAPYIKAMMDALTVNGKLYALPTHAHYGTNVLFYNRALVGAAGVTIPADGNWTTDDFIAAGQKLTRRGEDMWAFWPDFSDISEFGVFWLRQFGGEFVDTEGKKVLLDTAEARAGLQWVYDVAAKHQLINDLYRTDPTKDQLFEQQGRLALRNHTPGLVAEYRKPGQTRVSFDLGIALFPRHPSGRRGTQASGSGMGLTNPAKQDAVWEWLKFAAQGGERRAGPLLARPGQRGRRDVQAVQAGNAVLAQAS